MAEYVRRRFRFPADLDALMVERAGGETRALNNFVVHAVATYFSRLRKPAKKGDVEYGGVRGAQDAMLDRFSALRGKQEAVGHPLDAGEGD